MSNPLYRLPGLGAFYAAQDRNAAASGQELQQGMQMLQAGDYMQKQARRRKLEEMPELASGDANEIIRAYIRAGEFDGAAKVAQVSGVLDTLNDRRTLRDAARTAFGVGGMPTAPAAAPRDPLNTSPIQMGEGVPPQPSAPTSGNQLDPYLRYANALSQMGHPDKAVAFLKQAREALTPKYERIGTQLVQPPDAFTGAPATPVYTAPEKDPESTRAFEISLRNAGIDPRSPQGVSLYRAMVTKQATHAPANSTTVVMNQEKEEAKAVGKAFGDSYVDLQKAGEAAQSKLNRLDRMTFLMQGVRTGKLTPTTKQISEIADSLGFKIDATLPAQQAIQALSSEMALQARNPAGGAGMPGAMSDKDREFLTAMQPGLSMTPGGNELIIETMRKLAKRDAEVAQLARAYRSKRGTMDEGFYEALKQYSERNPLFAPTETKVVNGKTMLKINGVWMEQ